MSEGAQLVSEPGLTRLQRNVLLLIQENIAAKGVSPSTSELADRLGKKSKSNIHRALTCLEERGAIRRQPFRARAIEVLRPITKRPGDLSTPSRQTAIELLAEYRSAVLHHDYAAQRDPFTRQRAIKQLQEAEAAILAALMGAG